MKKYKYRSSPPNIFAQEDIADLAEEAGFLYDPGQEIFYSAMNPWQKKYGYTRLYDEAAALFGIIIDCEPIRFEYNRRMWLIEFWKGQYGISTGAEIGVYYAEYDPGFPLSSKDILYKAADGEDRLEMAYELTCNGKRLFSRRGKHWWLTGFVLGKFSRPSRLKMKIKITMRNEEMLNSFVSALRQAGYSEKEFRINGLCVKILFGKPHTSQPITRDGFVAGFNQMKNKILCCLFNRFGLYGNPTALFGRSRKAYTSCGR